MKDFQPTGVLLTIPETAINGSEITYVVKKGSLNTFKFQSSQSSTRWNSPGLQVKSGGAWASVTNEFGLKLLKLLTPNTGQYWGLLTFIGTHDKGGKGSYSWDADLRNQLMHNLRGVTEKDAIGYLTGAYLDANPKQRIENLRERFRDSDNKVLEIYKEEVQQSFRDALCDVGLRDGDRTENVIQLELDRLAEFLA